MFMILIELLLLLCLCQSAVAAENQIDVLGNHATISINSQNQSMVVWHHDNGGSFGKSIQADGTIISEFTISAEGKYPDIDKDGNSHFVIVWGLYPPLWPTAEVRANIIDINGNIILSGIVVNDDILAYPHTDYIRPDVAMNSQGDFIVAWDQGDKIFVRLFDSTGLALSPSVALNNFSQIPGSGWGHIHDGIPDVDMNDSGDVIVAWGNADYQGQGAISYRIFNAYQLPNLIGDEKIISPPPPEFTQVRPTTAINNAGDKMLAWMEYLGNGDVKPVQFQSRIKWYSALTSRIHELLPQTNQVELPTVLLKENSSLCASANINGEVYLRCYNSAGNLSLETRVNETTVARQVRPALASSGSGTLSISWESLQNHIDYGVYQKTIPFP